MPTTAGFEPARAKPKRFLIFLLNHSDKLPIYYLLVVHTFLLLFHSFK
ncbi:uncharacterized protein PRCAT00001189001 [Priceomyces carsonii]|nr:unnamed protein product [Priceomyces carsonii]